jgi:hypothetical protein
MLKVRSRILGTCAMIQVPQVGRFPIRLLPNNQKMLESKMTYLRIVPLF